MNIGERARKFDQCGRTESCPVPQQLMFSTGMLVRWLTIVELAF